jgi:hypothetical protein
LAAADRIRRDRNPQRYCRIREGHAAFVSRVIRLAYLSPAVLEQLVTQKAELEIPVSHLSATALEPWAEQGSAIA